MTTGTSTFEVSVDIDMAAWAPSIRDNPYLDQANWYVDGQNSTGLASDNNDGTLTAPLLTVEQLSKRLGTGALRVNTRVYLMSDCLTTDDASLYCKTTKKQICFVWYGQTVQASGTFTAHSALVVPAVNSTGGAMETVTDSAVTSANFWATYASQDYIVYDVTADAYFKVQADLGAKNARISTPMKAGIDPLADESDAAFYYNMLPAVINVGDTYRIYKRRKIYGNNFITDGGNFVCGVGFIGCVLGTTDAANDQLTGRYSNLCLVNSAINGAWEPHAQPSATFYTLTADTGAANVDMAHGIFAGGIITGPWSTKADSFIVCLDALLTNTVNPNGLGSGACLMISSAYLVYQLQTNAWESNVAPRPTSGGTISIAPYFLDAARLGGGYVFGDGAVRAYPAGLVRMKTSMGSAIRCTGGPVADNGLTCFTFVNGAAPVFRTLTRATFDAATGSSGFGGACQTVNGTRFVTIP